MKMYKSSCVALAICIAGSASALAADLPSRTVVPVAPIIVPLFTWTGFYLGVNAGYGGSTQDDDDSYGNYYGAYPGAYLTGDSSDGGFVGGGQIGYNYQFGQFVAGIEADIQYADLGSSGHNDDWAYSYAAYAAASSSQWPYYGAGDRSNSVEWFGTLRARFGVAFDRALVYATAGLAYGGGNDDNNNDLLNYYYATAQTNGDVGYYGSRKSNDASFGFTVGAGLEYAFTDSFTAKLEGLYVNLGDDNNNSDDYASAYAYNSTLPYYYYYGTDKKRDSEFAVVRAGVNYKFSGF